MAEYIVTTDRYFKNEIYNGDCLDVLRDFCDEAFALTVTSPPYDNLRTYNGNAEQWNFEKFKSIAKELYRVTERGGVVVWVVGDQTNNGAKTLTSYKQALYFQEIGFNMFDVIIYEKAGTAPPHKNRYFSAFEYMFVLSKGKPKTVNLLRDKPNKWAGTQTFGSVTRREADGSLTDKGKKTIAEFGIRTNIWRYVNGKGFSASDPSAYKHPAIFPEKLAYDHIISWSNPGDYVLDPFMGSGTTGIACIDAGRNFVGIEIDKTYFNIARQRIENKEKSFFEIGTQG